jgi:hypothetical protein
MHVPLFQVSISSEVFIHQRHLNIPSCVTTNWSKRSARPCTSATPCGEYQLLVLPGAVEPHVVLCGHVAVHVADVVASECGDGDHVGIGVNDAVVGGADVFLTNPPKQVGH